MSENPPKITGSQVSYLEGYDYIRDVSKNR